MRPSPPNGSNAAGSRRDASGFLCLAEYSPGRKLQSERTLIPMHDGKSSNGKEKLLFRFPGTKDAKTTRQILLASHPAPCEVTPWRLTRRDKPVEGQAGARQRRAAAIQNEAPARRFFSRNGIVGRSLGTPERKKRNGTREETHP
ncbi:hypothetical protein EYF80_044051 [Liparis tanakae]|uniref:Uncharacterized protein n=1 Tax=Liparis tanakae TaxID=230148 RepID=A0A4Z2FXM8_9TELE|nr:hypothetical protein EYF80_044051 [Liparis tanakae]